MILTEQIKLGTYMALVFFIIFGILGVLSEGVSAIPKMLIFSTLVFCCFSILGLIAFPIGEKKNVL